MNVPSIAVIEAPSVLGLWPRGVQDASAALLKAGLAERLAADHAGRVDPPTYIGDIDPATGIRNAAGITTYTEQLADVVTAVLDNHQFPLVLGGDCSVVLGPLLALRRRGRHGLAFLDGHSDYWTPTLGGGEAASMDLRLALGHGPNLFEHYGSTPTQSAELVRPDDVAAIGQRDADQYPNNPPEPLPSTMLSLDLPTVRTIGAASAGQQLVDHLTRPGMDGFWIHLDSDVLDDTVMPAVDYRLPGGLAPDDLTTIIAAAVSTGRAQGMTVSIYNPRLDPAGRAGDVLIDVLTTALHRAPAVAGR